MKRIVFVLAAFIMIFSTASAQWGSAVVEPIETGTTNDATLASSLGLDFNETLHVLFKRTVSTGNVDYYYTYRTMSGTWAQEIPVGDTTAAVNYGYMAVNKAAGLAYIVYLQNGAMKLAVGGPAAPFQIFNIVLTGIDAMFSPALTVDDQGRAHCAVVVQLPGNVYKIGYGWLDPTTGLYSYQVLNDSQLGSFGSGASPDIAALSNGAVVISYRGGGYTNYQIDLAENSSFGGLTWNIQTIAVPGYQLYSTSLGESNFDVIHLAFSGDLGWGMPASVFYTHRTAPNTWSQYINVSGNISGVNPKIAVEIDETCHVLFEKRSGNMLTGDIYYTGNVTGNWQEQLLQSGDKYEPSIIVDNFGNCSAVYYHYAGTSNSDVYYYGYVGEPAIPEMTVTCDPVNPPVQIPAGGGSFTFNVSIFNGDISNINFDFWTMATLPSGAAYGPILQRNNMVIVPGQTLARNGLMQNIPGSAPAGQYTYTAYAGDYPSVVYAQDSFTFSKLGVADGGNGNWDVYGFDEEAVTGTTPDDYTLLSAFPNPFNNSTTITFNLPEAGEISLKVFDVSGREVAEFGIRNSEFGENSMVWDAKDNASGVYFVRLEAAGNVKTSKVVLLK